MGDLIVLPHVERAQRPVPTADRTADILFFTGVRYYRMTDEMPAPPAKPRRRRRPARSASIVADVGHTLAFDCHA